MAWHANSGSMPPTFDFQLHNRKEAVARLPCTQHLPVTWAMAIIGGMMMPMRAHAHVFAGVSMARASLEQGEDARRRHVLARAYGDDAF